MARTMEKYWCKKAAFALKTLSASSVWAIYVRSLGTPKRREREIRREEGERALQPSILQLQGCDRIDHMCPTRESQYRV